MTSIPPPAPMLEPGFRLDRYELLCKIGQGGMATVWLARTQNSQGDERLVAIKTILSGLGADESIRAMLLDEARIATAIDHPNVAVMLEVGQLWDMPYLVLEYVEGESLDTLCRVLSARKQTVPAAIVVRVVADAAAGLHAAHELVSADGESLEIVHRDVSPANVLVDELGQARVIDFGVAKATERATPETEAGVMKGRVPYMAPEHASGQQVDRRSDVWSLGVLAYYMLSGRYPFDGANDAARLIKILGNEPADPLPDSVRPELRDVVMKALEKDPDARYATAADLRAALKGSLLPATHEEVATYFKETLAQPIKVRHALVEHALAAADARARARELLDGPISDRSLPPKASMRPTTTGHGTLGRAVTVSKSGHPPSKPWLPWVMPMAFAFVVIGAFSLGSLTGRSGETRSGEGTETKGGAGITANANATTTTATAVTASATAATATATASTTASAASSATAASTGSATTPPRPSASAKPGPIYTWPPPTTSAPPKPSGSGKKPPPKEDTIF